MRYYYNTKMASFCNGPLCLLCLLFFGDVSSALNVTLTIEEEYIIPTDESISSYSSLKIIPRALFGALQWNYKNKGLYMAKCEVEEDCDAGIRMICKDKRCNCKLDDIFFEWPKYGCFSKARMFGPCEVSGQCVAMNPHTYCNPDNGRCTCSPNYFYNGRECSIRYDTSNLKAQEVYKAAVVAAACFIVAVVGIFVACIVRRFENVCNIRSFCRRDQHLQQGESSRDNDIFSISDEIAALRAVDKPPSYEEVLQIERTFYGIPPPEYSAPRGNLAAFQPPPSFQPVPTDCVNHSANPSYMPPTAYSPAVGPEATSSDYLKDFSQEAVLLDENSSSSSVQMAAATNFTAAAEVLPPPPSEAVSQPLPSTFHNHHPQFISSTPPPRLHRIHLKPPSSSLPGSPHLSSISSQIRVLNLPNPSQRELLSNKDSSSSSSSISTHETPLASHPQDNLAMGHAVRGNESSMAYDNLGFVSDLHV